MMATCCLLMSERESSTVRDDLSWLLRRLYHIRPVDSRRRRSSSIRLSNPGVLRQAQYTQK